MSDPKSAMALWYDQTVSTNIRGGAKCIVDHVVMCAGASSGYILVEERQDGSTVWQYSEDPENAKVWNRDPLQFYVIVFHEKPWDKRTKFIPSVKIEGVYK